MLSWLSKEAGLPARAFLGGRAILHFPENFLRFSYEGECLGGERWDNKNTAPTATEVELRRYPLGRCVVQERLAATGRRLAEI